MMGWWKRRRTGKESVAVESIFSPEAMRRAWRATRGNGAAPGVDQVTIRQFKRDRDRNLGRLRQELVSGTYEPKPVKRVLVPKTRGGLRPLAIWTLRDRIAQRVVHDYLTPLVEARFLPCSYGFRPGRSVQDAVQAVLEARDNNRRWVVDADIEDCFGSLDPGLLMKRVRAWVPNQVVVTLIEKWLHAPIYNPVRGQPTRAMASQGGVITPVLANLYLHTFDMQVTQTVAFGTLVRFADDFVLLCRRRREAEKALISARGTLKRIRLQLNARKTGLVHFDEGFKFLGVFFLRNEHFDL